MSDPAKNVEIEDVLSSIRRLVSENGRSAAIPEERPVAQTPVDDAPEDDRLVLTDALRVATPAPAQAPTEYPSHMPDNAMAREMQEDIVSLRNELPSFMKRRIEIEAPDDIAGEGPELDALDAEFAEAAQEMLAETTPLAAETSDDDDGEGLRPWESEGEVLSEWQSVRSSTVQEFEPDEPGDSDYAGTPVASLAWEDHAEPEVADDPEPVYDDYVEAEEPSFEEPEPSFAEEAITDSVIEGVAQAHAAEAEEPAYEAVLDEEMLRDLVGEIVRQELQGPLGERITRNVRKLVRREINRTLTTRDLNSDL